MKRGIQYTLLVLSLIILVAPMGFSAISDSMVSYWTFDNKDTLGDTAVDIQGKNNGTIYGVYTNSEGIINNSYNFSGDTEYVEAPVSLSNDEFTYQTWLYPNMSDMSNAFGFASTTQGTHGVRFVTYKNSYQVRIYEDGSNNYLQSGDLTKDWTHITVTYNDSNFSLYKNGNLIDSEISNKTKGTDLRVGGYYTDGSGPYWEGKIDEVAIWNRSLTSSEIKKTYNRTKSGRYDYLGNYKLDIPLTSNFSTGYGTTNFSAVDDLTIVPNMTLATSSSKVNWKNNINAKNQNYDKNVKLDQGLVSVNSSALDTTINSSATVSLDVSSCSGFDIYKADKPVDSLSELKSQGVVVGDESGCSSSYCGNVSCSSGELSYDVTHFSSTGSDSTSSSETVPEFSTYTLLLAVAITILGFYGIRE